jgi:Flp pilus assembly protein TadB
MKRLLVFALAASLGHVTPALAGGSLLQSGTRHVQEMAQAAATVASPAAALPTTSKRAKQARPSLQSGQSGQQTLEGSGMRTRTKVLIGIAAAVGFAASIYAIDQHVVDVTPSSLGTRQD